MQSVLEWSWVAPVFRLVLWGTRSEDPDLQRADLLRQPQLLQGGDEPTAGPDAREDPQPGESQESPGEKGERRHRHHCGTTARITVAETYEHMSDKQEFCVFLCGESQFYSRLNQRID